MHVLKCMSQVADWYRQSFHELRAAAAPIDEVGGSIEFVLFVR